MNEVKVKCLYMLPRPRELTRHPQILHEACTIIHKPTRHNFFEVCYVSHKGLSFVTLVIVNNKKPEVTYKLLELVTSRSLYVTTC